jgi:hypothetical protein
MLREQKKSVDVLLVFNETVLMFMSGAKDDPNLLQRAIHKPHLILQD